MRRLSEYITLNLVLLLVWAFFAAIDGSVTPLEGALLFDAALIGLLHSASLKRYLIGTDGREEG